MVLFVSAFLDSIKYQEYALNALLGILGMVQAVSVQLDYI